MNQEVRITKEFSNSDIKIGDKFTLKEDLSRIHIEKISFFNSNQSAKSLWENVYTESEGQIYSRQ